jgi:ZIP family zinc transporter
MSPDIEGNVALALGLTLFAGLATGLGGVVVFLARKPNLTLLSFGLGLSSGVMIYISLVELLPVASKMIGESRGVETGEWLATLCFFGGMLVAAAIDMLIPEPQNPHEAVPVEVMQLIAQDGLVTNSSPEARDRAASLARLGPLTAAVIALHNLPEGMATFASALADTSLGVSIAVAVAIHNIPEGISVGVLTLFATGSRNKAVFHSFASGMAEPLGALIAYLVLMSFLSDVVVASMLAGVGGVMVFISFDELFPAAREYGKGHTAIAGVVVGMALMAVSLLVF